MAVLVGRAGPVALRLQAVMAALKVAPFFVHVRASLTAHPTWNFDLASHASVHVQPAVLGAVILLFSLSHHVSAHATPWSVHNVMTTSRHVVLNL